jgi:hypothetical protein
MQYADGAIMYVCGPDPASARACREIHEATLFSSPEEAIAFRDRLPHQEGDFATQYTVHEWQADDHAMPV